MTHPLPPLPEPYHGFYAAAMYTADQMRDYACAALADDAGFCAAVRLVCEATPGQLPMALDALRDHAAIAAAQPSAEPDHFPGAGGKVVQATGAWQPEALLLRLQAESEMWRQRGDAHLCALLDDVSAALAQPSATSAEPADEPLRVAHISLYADGRMTAAYMLEDGAKMLALLLEDGRLTPQAATASVAGPATKLGARARKSER